MRMGSIERFLERYVRRSREILKDDLTGIYLHGSAVMGCFHPDKSDIDLIVVVREPLEDRVKKEYMDMVVEMNASAPKKGIEMSVVTKAVCKPFVYPTPFELHFSAAHLAWYQSAPDDYIQKMKGTDRDLAAHFTVIKARGRCLWGEPIKDVFAEIPKEDYLDAIRNDIADAAEEIADDTMYLTLNLARVLAYQKDGLILSKKEGGEWALENLPGEYHGLIKAALREYAGTAPVTYDLGAARRYAGYMMGRIGEE